MLMHRGFIGQVEYDSEQNCFVGEVINANDLLEFKGRDVKEIKTEFINCIDQYLQLSKEMQSAPVSPFIGRFNLFLSPLQQKQVINAARVDGVNVESWLNRRLNQYLLQHFSGRDAKAS